jgi:hypothetical protein
MKAQVEELRGQAASASQKADTALASKAASPPIAMHTTETLASEERLVALAARYDHIRETQKAGGLRTAAMADVVGEMIALAPSVPNASLAPLLIEKDGVSGCSLRLIFTLVPIIISFPTW